MRIDIFEPLLLVRFKEPEEKLHRQLLGQQPQLVGILDVHDFVADVVGGLDEIHQRVAGMARSAIGGGQQVNAQLASDVQKGVPLWLEVAELGFRHRAFRTVGIFHDGGQRGVGHHESPPAPAIELVREQTERVGVAVEAREVQPLLFREVLPLRCDVAVQPAAAALAEVGAYGSFARVAEGRVPHVVGQAGRADDSPQAGDFRVGQLRVDGHQFAPHVGAQRAAHA